jgi:hypothetical protein
MKTTARDKWLMALIPALLTGVVYILFSGQAAGNALTAARAGEKSAEAAVPAPSALAAVQKALKAASDSLVLEKLRAAKLLAAKPPQAVAEVEQGTGTLRLLSQVVAEHKLSLIKSEKLTDGKTKGVPESVLTLSKTMAERGTRPQPEFWLLKIRGSYQNMVAALQSLDQATLFIVPISVGMELPAVPGGELEWSLTLWI